MMPQTKKSVLATLILAVPVLLLSINLGQADHDKDRLRCGTDETKWDQCFDCSLNPDHRFCSWEDADKNTPDRGYVWIRFALDWECNLYIEDREYSADPCSLAVPDNATDQVFNCYTFSGNLCEDFNPDEPYTLSVGYHFEDKTEDIRLCSSGPCSGVQFTAVEDVSWGEIKGAWQ